LENWKKLLEEANGELEERIRSLFLKKEKEEGPENLGGGVIGSKDNLFLENSRQCCDEASRRRKVSSSVAKSLG
jgi:hypothetical protein